MSDILVKLGTETSEKTSLNNCNKILVIQRTSRDVTDFENWQIDL